MSMPEPEIDRLRTAAKDRSRQIRKHRRNLVGGSFWAVVVIAAVVSLTLWSQSSSPRGIVPTGQSKSTTTTTSPSTTMPDKVPTSFATSTAKTTPPHEVINPAPENIAATTQVKAVLIAAFARFDGIPVSDIDMLQTESGPFYVALVPQTHTYWAVATMEPSASAPAEVKIRFQDGTNRLVFASQSISDWAVVNQVGEPSCLVMRGLPLEVQTLWGLPPDPECPSVSQATMSDPAARYEVTMQVPAAWSNYASGLPFDRFGTSGFVQISGVGAADATLESECQKEASGYGSAPSIGMGVVEGHDACFIFPSGDGPSVSYGAGMPRTAAAAVLVQGRQSPLVGGTESFGFLLVRSDVSHLEEIAASLQFSPGH